MDSNETALLTDTSGAPVMSGTGLCWHTGYGPAPAWTAGCHAVRPAPVAQYVAPVAQPAAAPAPVIAAPAPVAQPAPVIVAAAPLPVYESVAFDASVLFDSNKSTLRPAGRDALDAFTGKIHGLDAQPVLVIGYADRMGSEAANKILSEERAETVKSYLIGKGFAADRIQTSAWGDSRPNASTADCKEANTPKNVACLQPDRHVSIEISGSRLVK
jgi:OmpA-OmpF porin, OOP family